jgi:hypothetical protein
VTIALVLGAVLAAACVLLVALPFLREPASADDRLGSLDTIERRRLELAEERDWALAALKELELDHRTGKVTDEDYRALVGPLRRAAADALRALEPAAKPPVRESGPVEGVWGNREVPPAPTSENREVPPGEGERERVRA